MSKTTQPGDIIDRSYRLLCPLGEGAMGTVYKAVQLLNNQIVALKLVSQQLMAEAPDRMADDISYRMALAREFQMLASLHHPNVIRVLSYGFDDQHGSYFTMEFIDSPQNLWEASHQASEEAKVKLLAQPLRALSYIHRRDIIHRDIKPSNILLVDGEVKLLDFGIATKSGQASLLAGTVEFIAPELLLGAEPSFKSDLYAIGILFHLLLTNTLPRTSASGNAILDGLFDEDSDQTLTPEAAVFLGHRSGQRSSTSSRSGNHLPPSASPNRNADGPDKTATEAQLSRIHGPLGEIISRLLARNPDDRYASAGAVLRDLGSAVHYDLPVETTATRESFLQATALIGRQEELDRLTQALEHAKDRLGTAFLIAGESGVGKSRVLSELHTFALVHGAWVAEGQSLAEGGSYYHEWLPLLRALCFRAQLTDTEAAILKDFIPDIMTLLGRRVDDAPPIGPESALSRLAFHIIRILERLEKPLLFSLEDLHWGHSESIALLAEISQSLASLPVLFVATYRSDERPSLPQGLPAFQMILLKRLRRDDIALVSESMLGSIGKRPELIDYLTRHTEGNSFFLVEIVRALAENAGELERVGQGELPEGVLTAGIGRIVERRIVQVRASYQQALAFSAVLGRKLDLAALQHIFPGLLLRDFLLECANLAILESQSNDWRFAHDKLRDAILLRLSTDEKRALHQQAAETLENLYTGTAREPLFAALALHYQEAGNRDKALYYSLQAGELATQFYAYEQARQHYGMAETLVQCLPDTNEHKRLHVDILCKELESSHYQTSTDINSQRCAKAQSILDALHKKDDIDPMDRLRLARLNGHLGRVAQYSGKPDLAAYYFEKALPVAQEFNEEKLAVFVSAYLAISQAIRGDPANAAPKLLASLPIYKKLYGKDLATMRAQVSAAVIYAEAGDYKIGIPLVEELLDWLKEPQSPVFVGLFYVFKALWHWNAADWPETVAACQQVFQLESSMLDNFMKFMAYDLSAHAHSRLQLHHIARTYRNRAVEIRMGVGGGYLNQWFAAYEIEIYLQAGNVEEAREKALELIPSLDSADRFTAAVTQRSYACVLARLGAEASVVDMHFQNALTILSTTSYAVERLQTELMWGQACRERGNMAAAEVHFAQARQFLTDDLAPYTQAAARSLIAGHPP